jgi:hypothetical protein
MTKSLIWIIVFWILVLLLIAVLVSKSHGEWIKVQVEECTPVDTMSREVDEQGYNKVKGSAFNLVYSFEVRNQSSCKQEIDSVWIPEERLEEDTTWIPFAGIDSILKHTTWWTVWYYEPIDSFKPSPDSGWSYRWGSPHPCKEPPDINDALYKDSAYTDTCWTWERYRK